MDPLLDLLTGQEHLAMYARLKVRHVGCGEGCPACPWNAVRKTVLHMHGGLRC